METNANETAHIFSLVLMRNSHSLVEDKLAYIYDTVKKKSWCGTNEKTI
jgi:uncharacterized protein YfkK (UPF0435 family)